MTKEEAVEGVTVDVEADGEHENGIIVKKASSTGLVKVMLLSGKIVVRHHDRLSIMKSL